MRALVLASNLLSPDMQILNCKRLKSLLCESSDTHPIQFPGRMPHRLRPLARQPLENLRAKLVFRPKRAERHVSGRFGHVRRCRLVNHQLIAGACRCPRYGGGLCSGRARDGSLSGPPGGAPNVGSMGGCGGGGVFGGDRGRLVFDGGVLVVDLCGDAGLRAGANGDRIGE